MAKIPLRTYVKNIENLIERGSIEQAIVHAKNILQTYPKHIDTYRLLGKAYLESQRYGEAADILQRVLSVHPDDFVSHIGMSIIREDEGNMDAAIWHMERAYEVQPFNPAVQDELRRLYGRRDGVEPPRIRLTRGALVRMYGRGELYQQAIAEIRAALAEEPQRLDLQVLLARMCHLSGQRVEATESCSAILGKLPYCYEANSILAEILPGTSREEDAKIFQQRVYSLDPYQAYLSTSAPTVDLVPDQAVTVDEFVGGSDTTTEIQAPEWTRTAGVGWEETPPAEELPSWLNTLNPQASNQLVVSEPFGKTQPPAKKEEEPVGQAESDEDLIPDWMKSAGWGTSDGKTPEQPPVYEEPEEPEATPGEIPSWLQSMAPESESETGQKVEQERLGWLDSILPGSTETSSEATEEVSPATDLFNQPGEPGSAIITPDWLAGAETPPSGESQSGTLPDWLSGITPAAEEAKADLPDWLQSIGSDTATSETSSEIPDWMRTEGPEQIGETLSEASKPISEIPKPDTGVTEPETPLEGVSAQPGDITDFLQGLDEDKIPSEISISEPEISSESSPIKSSGLTDFLQGLDLDESLGKMPDEMAASAAPEVPAPAIEPVTPSTGTTDILNRSEALTSEPGAEMPDMSMDAAMAWLESLAAKQGADEATLITPPDQRTETPPDWIQQAAEPTQAAENAESSAEFETPVTESQEPAQAAAFESELPDWLLSGPQAEETTGLLSETEAPIEQAVPLESMQAEPVEELPDWLKATLPEEETAAQLIEPEVPETTAVEPLVALEETESTPKPAAIEPTAGQPNLSDMDAAMAWLESLAVKQGADEATLITPPDQRTETPPDWIQQTEQVSDAAGMVQSSPAIETEIDAGKIEDLTGKPDEETALEAEAKLPEWIISEQPEAESSVTPAETQEEPRPGTPLPSAEIQEGQPDLTDMDAAMAWLESLAAKQGADEATLITPPDQRTEKPPDWVQQAEPAVEPSESLTEADSSLTENESVEGSSAGFEVGPVELGTSEQAEEKVIEAEAELPDWLKTVQSETEPEIIESSETILPTAEASTGQPDLSDMDAAMAWLESLAAKQGADEETLITPPEQRIETPPDWITAEISSQETGPEQVQEAPLETSDELTTREPALETPDWMQEAPEVEAAPHIEELPEAVVPTSEAPAGTPDLSDMDSAMAWLESLAAKQGADEATLITPPDQRLEKPPEWLVQETAEQAEEMVLPVEETTAKDLPEWMQEAVSESQSPSEPSEETPQEETLTPVETQATEPEVVSKTEAQVETQTTEWVQEFSGPEGTVEAEPVTSKPDKEETANWLQAQEPAQPEPVMSGEQKDASLDEWLRGLELESETPETASFAPAQQEDFRSQWVPAQEAPLSTATSAVEPGEIKSLPEAQTALLHGNLDAALAFYNLSIQEGQQIDEVIHDLRDALYRYPVDISIWQALGDAYARNNQLQEALNAYTKAEELLR